MTDFIIYYGIRFVLKWRNERDNLFYYNYLELVYSQNVESTAIFFCTVVIIKTVGILFRECFVK